MLTYIITICKETGEPLNFGAIRTIQTNKLRFSILIVFNSILWFNKRNGTTEHLSSSFFFFFAARQDLNPYKRHNNLLSLKSQYSSLRLFGSADKVRLNSEL